MSKCHFISLHFGREMKFNEEVREIVSLHFWRHERHGEWECMGREGCIEDKKQGDVAPTLPTVEAVCSSSVSDCGSNKK